MKYFGGVVVLFYAVLQAFGANLFADDDRGALPPGARHAPGGIFHWHDGFMGGK